MNSGMDGHEAKKNEKQKAAAENGRKNGKNYFSYPVLMLVHCVHEDSACVSRYP